MFYPGSTPFVLIASNTALLAVLSLAAVLSRLALLGVLPSHLFFSLSSLTIFPIGSLPLFTSLPMTTSCTAQSILLQTPFLSNVNLTHSLFDALIGFFPSTLINAATFPSPAHYSHRITYAIREAPFFTHPHLTNT